MNHLEAFRAQKDAFFRTHPNSPLAPEQQHHFHGLAYFPENPDLRLDVVVEPFEEQATIAAVLPVAHTMTLAALLNKRQLRSREGQL